MHLLPCLCLSSAHLSSHTIGLLRQRTYHRRSVSGWPELLVSVDPFGVFVSVPARAGATLPRDLETVFEHARAGSADFLRVDPTQPFAADLPTYAHDDPVPQAHVAVLLGYADEQVGDAYKTQPAVKAAIDALEPRLQVARWARRTVRELADAVRPRRMQAPAHAMDYDFLADLAERGVRVVDLRGAPYDVVFQGSEQALRGAYAEHWPGDPFPGLIGSHGDETAADPA